jgi:hypothetical protein
MDNNRNISINSGTYIESIQVQGDFVQGDQVISQNFNQDILSIQNLIAQFQQEHDPEEAVQKTAQKLAVDSAKNPEGRKRLANLLKYVASNGAIEAGIGKAIEIALKLSMGF